jgi:MFS transporter, UMF1 family
LRVKPPEHPAPGHPDTSVAPLGDRRARAAWYLYDWADSSFVTTIVAAVLPAYFAGVVCGGPEVTLRLGPLTISSSPTSLWGYAAGLAAALVAILSPILGAVADAAGRRKAFLALFAVTGMSASALLSLSGPGTVLLTLGLLVLGETGFAGAQVFYNSLLPAVSRPGERDSVSTGGFAWGYLGGGLLLALNVMMIRNPSAFGLADAAAASRASFLTVAVWWALFSIPLFRFVPERSSSRTGATPSAFSSLRRTLRDILHRRDLLLFLLAFLLYNDGVQTVILMATVFGKAELGLDTSDLVTALLITQAVGFPGSFAYGAVARRIGAKKSLFVGIAAYLGIVLWASTVRTALQFTILAALVGLFQGGLQAISRSFFSRLVPEGLEAEYFGFFSISTRFASIFGPLLFALVRDMTGDVRSSILATAVLFVAGGSILSFVRDPGGKCSQPRSSAS